LFETDATQSLFETTNSLNLNATSSASINDNATKVAAEIPLQSPALRNWLRGWSEIADGVQNESNAPLRVSGALTLSQAEVTGFPASGAGVQTALIAAPNFDVRLSTGKNVHFTSATLRTEVGGTLSVSGTPLRPRLSGTVTTRNGQIRFPNASARIEEGTIEIDVARDTLTQELRPRATIDATARGQVGRYAITIVLRGPLDLGSANTQNLQVNVTSNPPLSQDEAFAQLTGTSLQDLNGGALTGNQANQAYARAVVGLLSAPLFSGLERSLEQSLGLNSLTLDYRLNEPLGVEVGKAIGDRVFVTYRRSLARGTVTKPSSAVRVDFRIKGGAQLGAESDTNGRNRITIQQTFRF
jgi:autotransporter translocation and assembly factor TamB